MGETKTSVPDDGQGTGPDAGATDEMHSDAGKRALDALRAEVRELKSRIKAYESADSEGRDAPAEGDSTSEEREAQPVGTDSERDAAGSAEANTPTESPKPRFEGTGDGGARKGTAGAGQVTEHELSRMSPAQIDAARREGRLRDLLSG